MHPLAFLRSCGRTWRRHGAWAALQWGLEALVNAVVRFERLHIIELTRQPAAGPAVTAHRTQVADDATLAALQREGGWGIDDTKRALLRAGNTCLLSLVEGRIAGYTWVHTQGQPELLPGLRLQLPEGALYNFAGFTHPHFRGARLQASRHLAVWAQPDWADRHRMFGYVKATNFASRQGQARSGYRKIGTVLLLGRRDRPINPKSPTSPTSTPSTPSTPSPTTLAREESPRPVATWLSPGLAQRGLRPLVDTSTSAPQGAPPSGSLWWGGGWGWWSGPSPRRLLHRLKRGLERAWVGLVSRTVGPALHRRLLRQARRSDHHTYTCFHRSPVQLAALGGPVLEHLGLGRVATARPVERRARRLRVLLYACSNGAEAYTLSAWLAMHRPDLEVTIEASDLHADMVERARLGRYTWEEVAPAGHTLPERFIAQAFDRDGDTLVVNDRTRARVRFSCADIVSDDLRARFGEGDIVMAQNVLFHLPPELAKRAFRHVLATCAPGGALFVEGMDLDLRESLTRVQGLRPLAWRTREIHEESRRHIPARWWRYYYGVEPWLALRRDPQRRYESVFLKPVNMPLSMAPQVSAAAAWARLGASSRPQALAA